MAINPWARSGATKRNRFTLTVHRGAGQRDSGTQLQSYPGGLFAPFLALMRALAAAGRLAATVAAGTCWRRDPLHPHGLIARHGQHERLLLTLEPNAQAAVLAVEIDRRDPTGRNSRRQRAFQHPLGP